MGSFDDLDTAARARDIFKKQAEQTVASMIPEPQVGRVISVDLARLTAMVWFVGDEQPILVNLLPGEIPAQWAQRNAPVGAVSSPTAGYGAMVTVARLNGKLYVTNVLSGGQFSYDQQAIGLSLIKSVPSSLGQTIAGYPYETLMNLQLDGTMDGSTLGPGDAIQFGPFLASTKNTDGSIDITGGSVEMNVRFVERGIKTYKFTLLPEDLVFSTGASKDRWFRILPDLSHTLWANVAYEFDLDVCVRSTPYGIIGAQMPREIWFRLVKRTADMTPFRADIGIKTGIFQRARSRDERFIQEIVRSASEVKGYLGYHNSSHGFADRDVMTTTDNFGRAPVGTPGVLKLGDTDSLTGTPKTWAATSQVANWDIVNGKAVIAPVGTNYEGLTTVKLNTPTGGYDMETEFDIALDVAPTTNSVDVRAILRRVDLSNYNSGGLRYSLVSGSCAIFFIAEKRQANVVTSSVSAQVGTYTLGERMRIKAKIVGKIISVKAWRLDFEDEPGYTFSWSSGTTVMTDDTSGILLSSTAANNPTFTIDSFKATILGKPPIVTDSVPWSTGPWRAGYLRAAADLQRGMICTGVFTWSGASLKWSGNIVLGGIGRNRSILRVGQASISMPPTGEVINKMPGGSVTATSNGIALSAGQALYCGVPPGSDNEDLRSNLFLVDTFFGSYDYHLPEWAVLIASRLPGGNEMIRLGNGQLAGTSTATMYLQAQATTNSPGFTTAVTTGDATLVGVTFIAPPSGKVQIVTSAEMDKDITGVSVIAPQIALGGTVGAGAVVGAVSSEEGMRHDFAGIQRRVASQTYASLNPGDRYNAVLMHTASSGVLTFSRRRIEVIPLAY